MPVRSLNSSVLRWPDAACVDRAVREWAADAGRRHRSALRIGYFGSYARGDWGVGSDLDLVTIVTASATPIERRAAEWDLTPLPVPAEILVYTAAEWASPHFPKRLRDELRRHAIWVYEYPPS